MIPLFSDDVPYGPFLQYGSFGLLAIIMFWAIRIFFPNALKIHEDALAKLAAENRAANKKTAIEHGSAVTKLIMAFERKSLQCREERLQTGRDAASEREKDRVARHDGNNLLQKLTATIGEAKHFNQHLLEAIKGVKEAVTSHHQMASQALDKIRRAKDSGK